MLLWTGKNWSLMSLCESLWHKMCTQFTINRDSKAYDKHGEIEVINYKCIHINASTGWMEGINKFPWICLMLKDSKLKLTRSLMRMRRIRKVNPDSWELRNDSLAWKNSSQFQLKSEFLFCQDSQYHSKNRKKTLEALIRLWIELFE